VIVPPVAVEVIPFPPESDASTALNVIGTLVLRLPAEIVKVPIAMDPLGITLVVTSNIRHVVDPETLEHTGVFGVPIQFGFGATATVTAVTSAG
jgi:hypothetical protein